MKRLTGLDAAFLALETPHSTGHVGGLSVLDPSTAAEPVDLARVREIIGQRLPLVPVLRQRLVALPLGLDQPWWADDPDFDLTYHVREVALPAPGSDAQLHEQVARLHARPLDRSRPLWETYLISGLEGGRLALFTKVHHAAVDGLSGVELLGALADLTPEPRTMPDEGPFAPPPVPGLLRLAAGSARELARRPLDVSRIGINAVRLLAPGLARRAVALMSRPADLLKAPIHPAPPTPLNLTITPHRRFATATISLEEVKEVKNAFGVTVNDVVMAISAGILRTWLLERDALPDVPLVAMVPVSLHSEETEGLGNYVSAMLAPVATDVADPVARLHASHEGTLHAKSQHAALPQGLVDDVTDFLTPALSASAARVVFGTHLTNRVPLFNVVISNIPGPPVPVYFMGARMTEYFPVSVVADGLGLNVTVISYLGRMHFGLIADREVVPDVDEMAARVSVELAGLLEAARAHEG